jgi:2-amino-4-hydroxy-6-hydroxymethyldihydropteridine diphosphokinase
MIDVYLLLGSNLGDRQGYMRQAIELVEKEIAPVSIASSVYETQSWGKTDEPDYLNQVICIKTDLPASTVLEKILAIELQMGRKREVKWGSRIIDIDILFYGHDVINQPHLVVPHPQLHNRMFTLAPLAEIAPNLVHPLLDKHIFELKTELKSNLHVKKV